MILEAIVITATIGLIQKEVSFRIRMASLKQNKKERLLAVQNALQEEQEEQKRRDAKINAFLLKK